MFAIVRIFPISLFVNYFVPLPSLIDKNENQRDTYKGCEIAQP